MNDKEMAKRYIYEVAKRVPQDMREEIEMELQALIEDMCSQEELSVEEALQKLGDPAKFAKRYRDHDNYLIGPDYYDQYCWVLKLSIICVGISAVVSAVVQALTQSDTIVHFFTGLFEEFFINLFGGSLSILGLITIIFAVMEYYKVTVQVKPGKNWSVRELSKNTASVKSWTPRLLPAIPDKRAVISRGDCVFTIIFIIIFSALLLFAPQLFGAFHYENGRLTSIACIFNLPEWGRIVPLFVFSLFVGLIDEIIRLVIGYYCRFVMYGNLICNVFQIAAAVVLLKCLPIWNPDFAREIQTASGIAEFSRGDLLAYWGSGIFSNVMLLIIVLISLAEIGVTVYKTLRYE